MFYSCAPSQAGSSRTGHKKIVRNGKRSLTVDIHCHVHTPAADALVKDVFTIDVDPLFKFAGHLVDLWGEDHVLLGTDYPYDTGYYDPLRAIAAVKKLSAAQRGAIAGGNAARLLGIKRLVKAKG